MTMIELREVLLEWVSGNRKKDPSQKLTPPLIDQPESRREAGVAGLKSNSSVVDQNAKLPAVKIEPLTLEETSQLQSGTMPDSLFVDGKFDPRKGPSLYQELKSNSSTIIDALMDKLQTPTYSLFVLPINSYTGMIALALTKEDFDPKPHREHGDIATVQTWDQARDWLEALLKRDSINEHNINIVIDNLWKIRKTTRAVYEPRRATFES